MAKYILLALFSLSIAGCAEIISIPDRPNTYSIDCSPMLESMDTCYAAAKRYCPNGYKILSNTSLARANGVQLGIEAGWIQQRGLVIQCK